MGVTGPALARLRASVEEGEEVLAVGRAYGGIRVGDDIRNARPFVSGPGQPVLVTERRVLWSAGGAWMREVPFAGIRSYTEVMETHRYGLFLEHDPTERLEHLPVHRILRRLFGWWWGNREEVVSVTRSFLAFSHPDTLAARAIRTQLEKRGVPAHPPISLPKVEQHGARAVATLARRRSGWIRVRRWILHRWHVRI